jgi:hypothetical protein
VPGDEIDSVLTNSRADGPIAEGSNTICTITKLVKGSGTCSPASNTLLKTGKYTLTATYSGNYLGSTSKALTLTVKK